MAGSAGTGKSHLCQAIGYQAIKLGFVVLYRAIFDVVRDFAEDEAFAGQDKLLSKYLKPDLLIIDDMAIKQLPKRSGEYLFEIILRRYEAKSTMMTSNRSLEDWGKLAGDVPAGTPPPVWHKRRPCRSRSRSQTGIRTSCLSRACESGRVGQKWVSRHVWATCR